MRTQAGPAWPPTTGMHVASVSTVIFEQCKQGSIKESYYIRFSYECSFFFVEFRDRIINSYDELFGQSGNGTLDAVSQFSKKWGWYQSIFGLAKGDIRRFEDITKLSMHECFMMLSFMKDKADVEAKEIKKKFK